MREERTLAAAVSLSDDHWWITGGRYKMNSTEVYDENLNSFSDFVDLPQRMEYHEIWNLNQTHTVLISTEKLYLYDKYVKL